MHHTSRPLIQEEEINSGTSAAEDDEQIEFADFSNRVDHSIGRDSIFKSLEIKNERSKINRSLSRNFANRKSISKPLEEILGENAEHIAKLKLFDAP